MRRGERQQTGTLTTGLARAELALEEARELELRWPLCSEGCAHSPAGRRQTERKGQVSRDAWRTQAPPRALLAERQPRAMQRREVSMEQASQ